MFSESNSLMTSQEEAFFGFEFVEKLEEILALSLKNPQLSELRQEHSGILVGFVFSQTITTGQ